MVIFQKNLKIWDIAAGVIILKEAGGLINKFDITGTQDINIIASNPDINSKFKEKLINF